MRKGYYSHIKDLMKREIRVISLESSHVAPTPQANDDKIIQTPKHKLKARAQKAKKTKDAHKQN